MLYFILLNYQIVKLQTLLSKKEYKIGLLISGGLYLVSAIHDWVDRGMVMDMKAVWASLLWLFCFYWGPMSVFLFLKRHIKIMQPLRFFTDLACYFVLMFLGISVVSLGLSRLFDGYSISTFDRVFSALLWGGFFYNLFRSWLIYKSLQAEKLLRKQAQLQAIKGKLNPHFLFNSINSISSLIHSRPELADETLQNLADVLRYSLDTDKHEWVSLERELLLLNNYLSIEQVRLDDDLDIEIDIAPECLSDLIPPMLFQPIIENSFKHVEFRPLRISIRIFKAQGVMYIVIADNGNGYPDRVLQKEFESGLGLKLTVQRAELLDCGYVKFSNALGDLKGAVCTISFKSRSRD